MSELAHHPAAAIFPLMDGIELNALVDDIRSHGLFEPIVLLEGRVLDGRNRLRACEIAGVTPSFVEWRENGATPIEWVVSHNLHRRHLTTGQKAALALDLLPALEAEARERLKTAGPGVRGGSPRPKSDEAIGRSDEKAAALVGVGRTAVATAKAIQRRDETGEVVNAMRAGELNVAQAAREVGLEGAGTQSDGTGSIETRRDELGREQPSVFFGKGDKWKEAAEPLRRYLVAHEKRGFDYGHINNREAAKRIKTIDQLIEALTAARAGLEQRSHRYRLTS